MKTVKIFISSTFRDMNSERDVLIKNVFPRLRARAEAELNVRVQEIDLRWGVTDEQASKGQVLELCLGGIDECRPYFLCMIGQRYGWVPTPMHINKDTFERLLSDLSKEEKALLNKAYNGSVNDRVRSLDIKASEELKESVRAILFSSGIEEAGLSITEQEIKHVLDEKSIPYIIMDLDKVIKNQRDKLSDYEIALIEHNYKKRSQDEWMLEPGITEREQTDLSVLFEKIGIKRGFYTFFFIRKPCGEDHRDFIETDEEQKDRLEQLRSRLTDPKHAKEKKIETICQYDCKWEEDPSEGRHHIHDLEAFENTVFNSLWSHIINNPELKIPDTKLEGLDLEEELNRRFAENRIWNFCGREDILQKLQEKAQAALRGELTNEKGVNTQYVMLTGESGSGKSAIMAKLKDNLIISDSFKDAIIIGRFAGATGNSTSAKNLMTDFVEIIKKECGFTDEVPFEFNDLKKLFVELITKSDRKVVILIDAVNQLRKEPHNFAMWLPRQLPNSVSVVLSIAEDMRSGMVSDLKTSLDNKSETENITEFNIGEERGFLEEIRKWHERPYEIKVKALKDSERKDIIKTYLKQFNKNISDSQINLITVKKEARNPLFLQVALEELRMVSRHEELPVFFDKTLRDTVEGMFEKVLERLEGEMEFVFSGKGRDLFVNFVEYMAVGRNGMTEEDLRLLLGDWRDIDREAVWEEKKKRMKEAGINDFHWAELKRGLRAYLFQSGEEWNFFHQQLKQAVGSRYMYKDEIRKSVHIEVAEYLDVLGYDYLTTVKDLPYHFAQAELGQKLADILRSFIYIEAKLDAFGINALLSDYDFTHLSQTGLSLETSADIDLICKSIRLSAHILIADKSQIASQLWCRMAEIDSTLIRTLLREIEIIKEERGEPWYCPYFTCFDSPDGPLVCSYPSYRDSIQCIKALSDGKHLLSSDWGGRLMIWNMQTGICERTIQASDKPTHSFILDPSETIAVTGSHDGMIKHWNINTGECINKINSEQNVIRSLALSDDGKTLLSGSYDHIVKKWDLVHNKCKFKSKKYEYAVECVATHGDVFAAGCVDLYTPDGNREISWWGAPYCKIEIKSIKNGKTLRSLAGHEGDIYSLEFSRDGKYLASCSEDKSVKIWDVHTGQCLYTLTGHKDYVYSLCFSKDSKTLYSGSADKTIKVWDISTGECINTIFGHAGTVLTLSLSPDESILYSAGDDSMLKMWDVSVIIGRSKKDVMWHKGFVRSVAYHKSDNKIVSSTYINEIDENMEGKENKFNLGDIRVWEAETGNLSQEIHLYEARAGDWIRLACSGMYALASFDYSNSNRGIKFWVLPLNKNDTFSCVYPNDFRIEDRNWFSRINAAISYDGCIAIDYIHNLGKPELVIWDILHRRVVIRLDIDGEGIDYLFRSSKLAIFSNNQKFFLLKSNRIEVWDIRRGKKIEELTSKPFQDLRFIALSSNDEILACGNGEYLTMWDTKNKRLLPSIICKTCRVYFSDDSKLVYVVTKNYHVGVGDVILAYEVSTGRQCAELICESDISNVVNGKKPYDIIFGDSSGRVYNMSLRNYIVSTQNNSSNRKAE